MLSTALQRQNLGQRPSIAGYKMFPRNCPTDVSSQSEVGETLLTPFIIVPKSTFRVYNQAETDEILAARKVCAYLRCFDPSKYPVAPNTGEEYFARYYDSKTSLPRG